MIGMIRKQGREDPVLVTGGAGFIGFYLCKKLLEDGSRVVALDNMNDYYDINLKKARLACLEKYPGFYFYKTDISSREAVEKLFRNNCPKIVINLAAQAGVRYSIESPESYIRSNLVGFFNILECCRRYPVSHLLFASSSSVYGANKKVPYSTEDKTDQPVSLYAATKKSNELMAYSYSRLYGIPSTGLRFFTVYGPFGRPDMAYFSFTKKILSGEPIKLFNHGEMYRDFTYIDDIITGIGKITKKPPSQDGNGVPFKVYNIGSHHPEKLTDFVNVLELYLGREAIKEFLPMQPGDVYQTYADITDLINDFGFQPETPLHEGIQRFVTWYREFYEIS